MQGTKEGANISLAALVQMCGRRRRHARPITLDAVFLAAYLPWLVGRLREHPTDSKHQVAFTICRAPLQFSHWNPTSGRSRFGSGKQTALDQGRDRFWVNASPTHFFQYCIVCNKTLQTRPLYPQLSSSWPVPIPAMTLEHASRPLPSVIPTDKFPVAQLKFPANSVFPTIFLQVT